LLAEAYVASGWFVGLAIAVRASAPANTKLEARSQRSAGNGWPRYRMSETRFIAEDFVETFADVVRD
jgi:hypothetical protein